MTTEITKETNCKPKTVRWFEMKLTFAPNIREEDTSRYYFYNLALKELLFSRVIQKEQKSS